MRSAGEAAQDERAVLVVAHRDELLRHQVHAVVERGHHAEVGVTVVGPDIAVLMMRLQIEEGPPRLRLERLVQLPDPVLDLALDLLVAIDHPAAGSGELHEYEPLAVFGIGLEEEAQRPDPLRQALGVVDALDPHPDELGLDSEPAQELGPGDAQRVVDELGRDADRERLHVRRVLAARHRETLPVDARLERAVDRLQEVVAVVLGVEADQVGAEHAEQELALPRADPERLEVGPRDVPEDGDPRVGALGLDERRQRREVIVLDEHQGRLGVLDLVQHGVGELLVHLEVVRPVVGPEHRARVHDVAQRPQPLVREAGVVPLLLLLREPHPPERVARIVDRHADAAAAVHGLPVGVAAAVRDPDTAARAHHGIHRGHEPAGRSLGVDLAAAPHVAHRLAVRHHDQ